MALAKVQNQRAAAAKRSRETAPVKPTRATPRPPFDPGRRATVLSAAIELFSIKGFERTTIRDIAKAAKLAEGTIYNHFENKTALMVALLDSLTEQGQAKVDMTLPADLDLHRFLPEHLRLMLDLLTNQTGKALPVILAELLINAELRTAHAKLIGQPQLATGVKTWKQFEKRKLVRKTRAELTVRFIGALLLGVTVQRLLGDDTLEKHWSEVPAAMAELLLVGLAQA